MLSSLRLRPKPGLNLRLASFGHVSHCSKKPSRSQSTLTGEQSSPGIHTVIGKIDIDSFRKLTSDLQIPLLLKKSHRFPASKTWFRFGENDYPSFSPYFLTFSDDMLAYEFTVDTGFHVRHIGQTDLANRSRRGSVVLQNFRQWLRLASQKTGGASSVRMIEVLVKTIQRRALAHDNPRNFQQFDAPAALLMAACQFNEYRKPNSRLRNLYVAQSNLDYLSKPLLDDLPVPDIVKHAGKGDIYGSSIWLGLQPTFTPLHRDPNPNLFCQLLGTKKIRLTNPDHGERIYAEVRRELGDRGSSKIRSAEMMEGPEHQMLGRLVWENADIDEVLVGPTDSLFIPKGWWHSVASDGTEGELNASVNWWFR